MKFKFSSRVTLGTSEAWLAATVLDSADDSPSPSLQKVLLHCAALVNMQGSLKVK